VTSVLFGDLVGFTSLSEARDQEDVRELLSRYFDECRTIVGHYGGTVEKFIGDAVMAVWGVPTAHEDDAERAVRAGLDLVEQISVLGDRLGIPQLALRVGIVTGEVAANLGATDQGIVAGDPVNTAARIQATAGPGEVWVDAQTRSLSSAGVSYFDAGEHVLKGKAEPVRLHRAGAVVAAVGGAQRMDGLEAPLVGRAREMRMLKELFHGTEEAVRPHLVVLDGEAGVGKTRLGWEFFKYIDGLSHNVRWHRGRCLSYGEGVAFWALAEAVRGRVGLVEDETGGVVLQGLDSLLESQVPDESERSWLRSRVASLLGEESRDFPREDLFAAWVRFFERVGSGAPVVLLIEDAQFADEGLVDFVEFLLANGRFACFVVLLARPELLAERPDLGGRRATALRIDPLADGAMGTLVDGLVDGLPEDVRAALVSRAEGIPLYAVETVRSLIDRDVVVPVEGRYIVAEGRSVDLATMGAPASLHALVASRLDALQADERRVLSDASVLGESFSREGIAILTTGVADLDGVLDSLARKELIATELDRFSAERGQFHFVQSVVRQVAYSTLSRRDRKAAHLLVASHLEEETERADDLAQVIAQHLLDAADAGGTDDEVAALRGRAGDLLVRAGERASALGGYVDATRCFEEAFRCLATPSEQSRAARLLAKAHLARARWLDGLEAAERAVELADHAADPIAAAEAAYVQCLLLSQLDRLDAATELCRARLESVAGLPGSERVTGLLSVDLAGSLLFAGRDAELAEPLQRALKVSSVVDDPELYHRATNVLALDQARHGSPRVANVLYGHMAEVALEGENWVGVATAKGNMAVLRGRIDLREARRLTEESRMVLLDHGYVDEGVSRANLTNYRWLLGEWDEVATTVGETLNLLSEADLRLSGWTGEAVAGLMTWAGRPVQPPDTSGMETGAEQYFRMAATYAQMGRALRSGSLHEAVRHARDVVRIEMDLSGVSDDLHVFWPAAIRVALAAGDEEAFDELAEVVAVVEREEHEGSLLGHAHTVRALRARRDDPQAPAIEEHLRAAVAILDRTGNVVWGTHARLDLGRFLLHTGREDEGRLELETARAAFEAMGATTWVADVESVLAEQKV
jgi:class 3 adenylate cyclase/tetratricopeptide (TPR) repeat protein